MSTIHYLISICFSLVLMSCATLSEKDSKEQDSQKVLETQMNIIINSLNQGEPKKAYQELRTILADNPDHPEAHNLMGLVYLALKKPKTAESYFRNAFKMKADPAFGLNISSALIERKQYNAAIRLLQKFKADGLEGYKYPERFDHNIGLALEKKNNHQAALRSYQRAIVINPASYLTLMQAAKVSIRLRRNTMAKEYLREAKDVCLKCYEPVKLLSLILTSEGRHSESLETLLEFSRKRDLREEDRKAVATRISRLKLPNPPLSKSKK